MLHDALRPALVDHIVHGVSILGVSPGDIVRVDPRYCYPLDRPVADDGALAAAVLVPRADRTLAVIQDGTETIHRLDHASSEDWSYPSGVLGQPVRRTAVPPRRYYTVPLAPADGAFGASMVRALLPPVAQYTTLMSSYQSQIVACANILVAEPAETGSIRVDVDAAEAGTTRPLQVAQLLGRAVEGYADLRFVGGEVGEQAYLEALTRIEREIHDISAVSPTLAGWLTDGGMAIGSGVAFSRSFVRTSARLGEIIAAFLPVLEAALAAAGQPAELEWINPLERLDQQALERTAHMTAAMGRQGGTDDAGPEADDE